MAFVRVGEDQKLIRLHGVDDSIRVSANALDTNHGSVVSGRERRRGVRPPSDVLPGFLHPVDEREIDPWLLRLVPAHGSSVPHADANMLSRHGLGGGR